MVYATAWSCTTTGIGEDCIVTATSTDDMGTTTATSSPMATTTPYTGMSYQEGLFLACVIIFFLALIGWSHVFRKY